MTQKTLLGLLGIIILLAIALSLMSIRGRMTDTATTTPDGTATTSMGAIPNDLPDGTYAVKADESFIAWTGSKPRVLGYEDKGTVRIATGTVTVANGAITGGEFSIDMNTIAVTDTSNENRPGSMLADHLKGDDFFDIAAYPNARFVITDVRNGMVTGDLTVKATTNTLTFPATVRAEGTNRLVAQADIELDRTEWDIRYGSGTFFQDLGDNIIADEVQLALTIVATK